MKKSALILTLILLIGLTSCKPTSMFFGKITGVYIEPIKESNESITAYCMEKQVNYDRLFVIKSEQDFIQFTKKYNHIPAVFIFDKNMNLVTTAVETDCPWAMINLLDHKVLESKTVHDTLMQNEILSHFSLINYKVNNTDSDYTMLCVWAKFAPKMTKSLFEAINKQKDEKKINVCHILLNVDLQKSWYTD